MNTKIKNMTTYSVLIAIMLIMSFTPLGYIRIGTGIEITLMCIPVIVGISLSGAKAGLVLGTVFGITSFIQCFGMSAFGAALLAVNPIFTFIVCMLPRILMGLVSGKIFDLMTKKKCNAAITYAVTSVITPLINTVLFVSTLMLFFGKCQYILDLQATLGTTSIWAFVIALFGTNAILEIAFCLIAGTAICKAVEKVKK